MYKNNYVSVIIAAAGMSNRMGSKINKQFIAIGGKPILAHTIEKFENSRYIDEIILVLKEDEIDYCRREIVNKYGFKKVKKIIKGGDERQSSVYNGILALNENTSIVLTHDGARPFIKTDIIDKSIREVDRVDACIVGVPVKDTIKVVGDSSEIIDTPNRSTLWAAQTPQCFRKEIIKLAHEKAIEDSYLGTDDSSLVERLGLKVNLIMGSYENIKITTPDDILLGETLIGDRDNIFNRLSWAFQN